MRTRPTSLARPPLLAARLLAVASLAVVAACYGATDRHDVIHPVAAANGLDVTVTPQGELGWQIVVKNDTPDLVQVMWDDSTFVTADGQSTGRIMRGYSSIARRGNTAAFGHEVARTDTHGGAAQAPSPIAPSATMTDWVVPEAFAHGEGTPPPGRLTIVFRRGDQTSTWQGDVVPPAKASASVPLPPGVDAGWYCVDPGDSGAPALCARDQDGCAMLAARAHSDGYEVGECVAQDRAACMSRPGANGAVTTCYASIAVCTKIAAALPPAPGATACAMTN